MKAQFTRKRDWHEVVHEMSPDSKPDKSVWPNGPSMDGIRPVMSQEEFEKRRKKALETPLP